MGDALRLKLGGWMVPIPSAIWRRRLQADAAELRRSLGFMTPDHHRVRDFVVTELPRSGRPLSTADIASGTGLSGERVAAVVEELEKGLVFLFRNPAGEVAWAYPVTVDETPHHVAFESGERLDAA